MVVHDRTPLIGPLPIGDEAAGPEGSAACRSAGQDSDQRVTMRTLLVPVLMIW